MSRQNLCRVRLDRMTVVVGILAAVFCVAEVAQAQLVPGQKVYWGEEPVEELSAVRGRQVLNGIWHFMPAVGPALRSPKGSWGRIWVPGAWHRQGWRVPPLAGVTAAGRGAPWDDVPLTELGRAWYEREITVPEAWRGREILLNIDRVCTDAIVYVNGSECGRVNWPHGKVRLTPFVEPDRKAVLRILVVTTSRGSSVEQFLEGAIAREAGRGTSFARGLVGDVILESRPKGTHIDSVFVQTSVRRQELKLDVDLVEVASPGQARFTALIMDAEGDVARRFEASADLSADAEQTVQLGWRWSDPKLWDLLQPNLYTLYLRAEGPGLNDEFRQRFGFREFRTEGKQFLLNEKPFRPRPTVAKFICYGVGMKEAIENQIDSAVSAGYSFMEVWPQTEMTRGLAMYWKLRADVSDEKGMPLMYPALNLSGFIGRRGGSEEQWAAWEKAMVEEWKKIRNHPSILILVCTANVYQHFEDQSPVRVGNLEALGVDTSDRLAQLFAPGFRCMDVIRKYETTRPVTTHHGAAVGDFHALDMYLNMIPLQEREEWLSAWAESDDGGPYVNVEMGTPWTATFHRGRGGGANARTSEPYLTEYCAIYFGSDAYRGETDAYRRLISRKYRGDYEFEMWGGVGKPDYDYRHPDYHFFPNHQRLQSLFIRNTWRSWRTWGMTGGLIPWENAFAWKPKSPPPPIELPPFEPGRLGPYVTPTVFAARETFQNAAGYYYGLAAYDITEAGRALVENNSATLAWLAGPGGAFTAKDHHFFPAVTVHKQIVLINDERSEQQYEASWAVEVAGRNTASGSTNGTIGVAQNLFIPLEFTTPEVDHKTDGKITMTARIGARSHRDSLTFRVLPRPLPPVEAVATVLTYDPDGDTTVLLERLGWETKPWDGRPAAEGVIVIGRHALDGGVAPPGSLEAFVAGGGRAIVFGQDPEWLREKVGFRVARHVSRRFYPVPSQLAHPMVAGLDSEDLRDWQGTGTLVPATANTNMDKDFSDSRAISEGRRYGWHWGNRGSVSSAAVEKPHRSGWRPILEGEFDLAYSPLMELSHGRGLLIWCSLDVEGRSQSDPLAQIIASRLLNYAAQAAVESRAARTVYIGGAEGEALLNLIGLQYERGTTVPEAAALLIVGPDFAVDDSAMRAFLSGGGRALFLARAAGSLPLGFGAEAARGFHGSLSVPSWPECRGLSESDLRLKTDISAPLLVSGPGEIGADGLLGRLQVGEGVAVFVQLAPAMLNAEEKTYMRFSTWRVTRTIAQLLGNLGATFEMDRKGIECLDGSSPEPADLYCPGYRTDFRLGDDPYRYKRW